MEIASRLRRHIGESAFLVDAGAKADSGEHLLDFTKSRRGKEITLIEVGEHGITVEFVASGQKHIYPFDELRVKEQMFAKPPASTKGRRPSRKGI